MAARQAVISLLKSLGEQQDDDIVDYIASVLEDADDDASADPDGLEELLSGAAPAFGALPGERRTAAVLDLFAAARGSAGASGAPGPSAAGGATAGSAEMTAEALVASLRQLSAADRDAAEEAAAASVSGRGPRASGASGGGGGSGGGSSSGEGDDLENADPQALAALRDMCGGAASDEFLAHVLVRRHSGDTEAAAMWLIDLDDVAAEEAAWRAALAEEREAAARSVVERKKSKAAILARFDLQAVKEPGGDPRKERPVEAWAAGKKAAGSGKPAAGRIRFRDGVIVSSNGEKFIIEKPPEYDGGSKGKVYTKGKRGKGFV